MVLDFFVRLDLLYHLTRVVKGALGHPVYVYMVHIILLYSTYNITLDIDYYEYITYRFIGKIRKFFNLKIFND